MTPPADLLLRFTRISTPEDVLGFARKFGVLRLAEKRNGRFCREPLHLWLHLARQSRALLNIASAVHQDRSPALDDWDSLYEGTDRSLVPWLEERRRPPPEAAQFLLSMVINGWLTMCDARPMFQWLRDGPRKAKRLQEMAGGLLPLQQLADEYHIHVRTLRKAAQDGRLQATFSTRMAFGKLVAFASRDAVETFKRRYYRQTTQWNRPPPLPGCTIPDDYDRVLVTLRARLRLTQRALAERIGAANKAVVYQWESRRRRPSPVLWQRVQTLGSAP